ncbi:MAG: putative bifunctional diguanylate cyclase/phosphodiesterase [Nocardioidaceae bacterium]
MGSPALTLSPAARRLLALAAACVLLSTATELSATGRSLLHASALLGGAYQVVYYVGILACGLAVLAAAGTAGPGRLGWVLIGLGPLSYLLGDVAWDLWVRHLSPVPYPSVADAGYLLMYPLVYAGLVLLFRSQAGRVPLALWLDGIVGGLGIGAVAASYVLGPVLRVGYGRPAMVATNLAYPVADLVLVVELVAMLSILGRGAGLRWLLLLGGCTVLAVTDAGYLMMTAAGSYTSPSPVDHGWQLAFLLMALAAATRPGRSRPLGAVTPVALVPLFSALAATAVLVRHRVAGQPVATTLAAAAVVLTLVRLAVTVRETSALADTHRMARTDELTGLPNRRAFYERTRHLSAAHAADGRQHAVLLVDLDRFKEVNDSFGHLVGDDLLRLVGPRLAAQCGREDLIARLGGDEFGIVVLGHEAAEVVAERLCRSLEEPFVLRDLTVQISASVGIAHYPDHGTDGTTLLRRADVAMYAAKRARAGWRSYDAAEDPNTPDRLYLLDALRTTLADSGRGLELHYQPKLDLAHGRLTGVEALVRWRHPKLGLLPPAAFLPLMEEYGLSRALTDVVLRQAIAQCARWQQQGLHLPVAVNLPASLCTDPDLPGLVSQLLDLHGVLPGCLELEITEEFLLGDRVSARAVLTELGAVGVRVSIDDFGTGYSSLAYLRDLPVDQLKLDRTFITGMEHDATTAALVRSAVSLAHSLGLEMVAEGVETPAALELLRQLGCDQAQGFHVGHPLPADELSAWISDQQAPRLV